MPSRAWQACHRHHEQGRELKSEAMALIGTRQSKWDSGLLSTTDAEFNTKPGGIGKITKESTDTGRTI